MRWLKVLFTLIWYDIKLMPCRVRLWLVNTRLAYLDWKLRLIDRNLERHGIAWQEPEWLAQGKAENRRKLSELMRLYAEKNPGATVHDFNNFWEHAPVFHTPRFVLATIIRGSRFWEE